MKHLHTIRNFILATRTGKAVFMALAAIMAATTIAYALQGRRGPKVTSITVAPATPAGLAGTTGKSIGDSYGGGIIAYILQPGQSIGYIDANGNAQTQAYDSNVQHGLIAATADYHDGETSTFTWGPDTDTDIANATSETTQSAAFGQGAANTVALGEPTNLSNYPAAAAARAERGGGYDDWYLPSLQELNKLYVNLHDASPSVGGFAEASYWSSSESGTETAWELYFKNGGRNNTVKTFSRRVRAVRAF